jgi:hypothetical protein
MNNVLKFANATRQTVAGRLGRHVALWCRDHSYNRKCCGATHLYCLREGRKLVGKRLRMRRHRNLEWLLSKVHAFNGETESLRFRLITVNSTRSGAGRNL